jgi:hypothetical protein
MVFVYFLDFKSKRFIEKTIMAPFGKGCEMPSIVNASVTFQNKNIEVQMLQENNATHIITSCKDFGGVSMEADFTVTYPKDHETLSVVIPWNRKTFQFTSKHECLPTHGKLRVGENNYTFDNADAFACLDFGRGIWPYKVKWNWANASGIADNRKIGLNLGGKWTDGTGMNENAIVVDGRLTKISEDLIFGYDNKNFMAPWTIKTSVTDRINLTFTPFYERIAKSNLGVIKSEVHQMVGHFSGVVKTESNESITIDHLLGCSEDHFGQW